MRLSTKAEGGEGGAVSEAARGERNLDHERPWEARPEIRVVQPKVDRTKHKTPSLTVVGIKNEKKALPLNILTGNASPRIGQQPFQPSQLALKPEIARRSKAGADDHDGNHDGRQDGQH
jgi:hypothetical protein